MATTSSLLQFSILAAALARSPSESIPCATKRRRTFRA
jgi:hypothetical protein